MQTLEEKLVEYYNSLIEKGNIPNLDKPVTFEWLKTRRIVPEREELNLRFGSLVVDNILGEKSYLARAEDMILTVQTTEDYSLLPNIACMLAWECETILDAENPIRQKYASFDFRIPIPIFEVSGNELDFVTLQSIQKEVTLDQLKLINYHVNANEFQNNYNRYFFFKYVLKITFHILETAFEEIKKEVEEKTK